MAYFLVVCRDKPGAFEQRLAKRDEHIAFVGQNPGVVRLGGAIWDEGDRMIGSMGVMDFPDIAAARAFVARDPYARSGLFQSVEIHAWTPLIGDVPGTTGRASPET